MQKTEEEKNSQEHNRRSEHKWRVLPLEQERTAGGRGGALVTIGCPAYPVLGLC